MCMISNEGLRKRIDFKRGYAHENIPPYSSHPRKSFLLALGVVLEAKPHRSYPFVRKSYSTLPDTRMGGAFSLPHQANPCVHLAIWTTQGSWQSQPHTVSDHLHRRTIGVGCSPVTHAHQPREALPVS